MGECIRLTAATIAAASVAIARPTPALTCDIEGNPTLTQSLDQAIPDPHGVACTSGGVSTDNYFARSYDLSVIHETAGKDYTVHCVEVGIGLNSGADHVATVTIYIDNDHGAPTAPGVDLSALGSTELVIPEGTQMKVLVATFDTPIVVPADSTMVVELFVPSPTPSAFEIRPGTNGAGETAPTYIMAPACLVFTYVTMASIGWPDQHWVQNVIGTTGDLPCPADLNGDGTVGILDLLALLAAWGADPGGPPDFDGDGNVGILDLLALLSNWGPCP